MGKRVIKIWDLQSSGAAAALLILCAAFLLGGIAGTLLAGRVDGGGGDALGSYLEGYFSTALTGETVRPALFSLIWETVRWPLFTFVLGLTALGLLGIPLLFLVRGFLLAFAIASFYHVLGLTGLAISLVVFGITGLIYIPVLFVLGIQGLLSAGTLAGSILGEGRRSASPDRIVLIRGGFCAAALVCGGLLEYFAVPVLLESLAVVLLA